LNCLSQAQSGLSSWQLLCEIGRIAANRGEHVALVGGLVRDLLLEVPLGHDIDLAVEGDAIGLSKAWQETRGGELLAHRNFQNATWKNETLDIDFVRARQETYPGIAQLPEVSPGTLTQDLQRRDFRINALAISLHPDHLGNLIDPTRGIEDITHRRLNVLHPQSFVDDPTRAFRAVRYAARLDLEIGDETMFAVDHMLENNALSALTPERLGLELERIFREESAPLALECASGLGLFDHLPMDPISLFTGSEELSYVAQTWHGEPIEKVDLLWLLLASTLEKPEEWARLVPGGGRRAKLFQYGVQEVRQTLQKLIDSPDDPGLHGESLYRLPPALRAYAAYLDPDNTALQWWEDKGRLIAVGVTSQDLLNAGLQPGTAFGEALRRAKQAAWRGANTDEQLAAALANNAL